MDEREKQIRELAAEATWQQQQAKDIQGQLQNLQMIEIEISKTTEALKNLKEEKISLFNLGSGVFVKGELKDINSLLINVGGNVLIEKDIESTLQFLEERRKEINEAKDDLLKSMQMISTRLKEIDTEARRLIKKGEK